MQFDVHENRGEGRELAPYPVDLQSDRVVALRMRVVAPLVKTEFLRPLGRLHPRVEVLGEPYTLSISELFAIDQHQLRPAVGNLDHYRDRIVAAIDMLFTGI